MGSQVEAVGEQLEQAIGTFQAQWAKLYQPVTGLPVYVPDVQVKREQQAHTALNMAIARANAVADEELDMAAAIEKPMREPGDPITSLLPVELSRASQLLPFAERDIGDLKTPVGQLAARQRCREAIASGDRAMAAVYLRVIRDQDGFEDVADQLAAVIWPALMIDRKKIAARRSSAQALKLAATNANLMSKAGGRTVGDAKAYALNSGLYPAGKL